MAWAFKAEIRDAEINLVLNLFQHRHDNNALSDPSFLQCLPYISLRIPDRYIYSLSHCKPRRYRGRKKAACPVESFRWTLYASCPEINEPFPVIQNINRRAP